MLLLIFLALTTSMTYILILRACLPCLNTIPWIYPLLGLVISGCIAGIVHIWSLPCWHILSSRPQRLHSFSNETARAHIPLMFIPFSFVIVAAFLLFTSIGLDGCPFGIPWSLTIFLVICAVYLYIYFHTACVGSSDSLRSSSSEESEASKVNASGSIPESPTAADSPEMSSSKSISSSEPEFSSSEPESN